MSSAKTIIILYFRIVQPAARQFADVVFDLRHDVEKGVENVLHQSTAALAWWCDPRSRLGWVKMVVGLSEGPSYPGHSPSFFRYAAP